VLVTEIAVVELTSRQSIIPLQNHAEEKLVVVSFPTCQDCQTARNVALNSTSLTLPLGTGSAAQAHIGRTVSVCFKGGTK